MSGVSHERDYWNNSRKLIGSLICYHYTTIYYRPREALNIIRITPRSSALYNAILYGKIVLAQYRTQGFFHSYARRRHF